MKRILAATILSLAATTAPAEPDSTVRALMNEPVSLFDMGIYRLNLFLDEIGDNLHRNKGASQIVFADYDWTANRITINVNYFGSRDSPPSEKDAKTWCESVVYGLDTFLFMGTRGEDYVGDFFGHTGGYKTDRVPDDYARKIIGLMEIRIRTPIAGTPERILICESIPHRLEPSFRTEKGNYWD